MKTNHIVKIVLVVMLLVMLAVAGIQLSTRSAVFVSADAGETPASPVSSPFIQLIVQGDTDTIKAQADQLNGRMGQELEIIEAWVVELPAHTISTFSKVEGIENVVLDAPIHNSDQLLATPVRVADNVPNTPIQANTIWLPLLINNASTQDALVEPTPLTSPLTVLFEDDLSAEWQDTSWSTSVVTNRDPVNARATSDNTAVEITFDEAWDGFLLEPATPMELSGGEVLSFWLHGGDVGGQQIWLQIIGAEGRPMDGSALMVGAVAGQWQQYQIAVDDLTDGAAIHGILWQSLSDSPQAPFFVDNIFVTTSSTGGSRSTNGLNYHYYRGNWATMPDFEQLTPRYSGVAEQINLSQRDRNEQFGFTFDGYLHIETAGEYAFFNNAHLYIDGQKVADSTTLSLTEGYHRIEVNHFHNSGTPTLSVDYSGPTFERRTIPTALLFPEHPAWTEDDARGKIAHNWWNGIGDRAELLAHPDFPEQPLGKGTLSQFETLANMHDYYSQQVVGYIHPPVSGEYTFWLSGNDSAELFLSTSEDPNAKQSIALVKNATGYRQWDTQPAQQSAPVYLEAGTRYYIEAVHAESNGDDHLSVAWQIPNGRRTIIDGSYLETYVNTGRAGTWKQRQVETRDLINELQVDRIHNAGIDGRGVKVALIDTGWNQQALPKSTYDMQDLVGNAWQDSNGHGTFMGLIVASEKRRDNRYIGIAPKADLMMVAALDYEGKGRYSRLVTALNNVRNSTVDVVNLSLQGPVTTPYWKNPVNQAVEQVWQAGKVVVVAAGNTGPMAGSITVPGNDPFVITVGAYTDNFTPEKYTDDYIPPFSAAGPTETGHVKPDVVAPGAHIAMPLHSTSRYAKNSRVVKTNQGYYLGSGTSSAAAVTSGIVALMLDEDPSLTPNQVKYRLMKTAAPIVYDKSRDTTFSIFQQGAGRIQPYQAVIGNNQKRDANSGMKPGNRYVGPTVYDKNKKGFVLVDKNRQPLPNGSNYYWNGAYYWSGGWLFSGSYYWSGGWLFSGNYYWGSNHYSREAFQNSAYYWSGNYYWSGSYYWSGNSYWVGLLPDG